MTAGRNSAAAAERVTVSVVIPLYNAAAVLRTAIESVLNQSYACDEIVLVDDGSTDGTRELIEEMAAEISAIKPVLLEKNSGASAARNAGFKAATGDWIAILDADDTWLPNRIERMLEAASEHGANYVLDNKILHDIVAGRDHRVMMVPDWDVLPLSQEAYWWNCRLGRPQFSILKMIVRRDFVEATGLRYDTDCGNGQDLIYHGEALALGAKAIVLAEPLYVYSTRFGGFSRQANNASRTKMNFIGIANRIDALRARRRDQMRGAADRAAKACRDLFIVGDRLNRYRDLRRQGKLAGWLKLAADPAGILLTLRMRYRNWATQRRRYLVG